MSEINKKEKVVLAYCPCPEDISPKMVVNWQFNIMDTFQDSIIVLDTERFIR